MKTRLLFFSFLLISINALSQPAETTYQGNVVVDGAADDVSYGPFNIGFTFKFFGNNYTQFYINSNGMVLFGTGSLDATSVSIPNAAAPNNYIAPFWDDLIVDASAGKIMYKTIGAAGPNRKCVIQFLNMGFYPRPVFMGTFSVILYETSNVIQVQYRIIVDDVSVKAHGSTATIGIENASGTAGVQYAFQNPTAVTSEQAISFTPSGPTYTMNSNALYDGIYLTENIALPGPGIAQLENPPQDAIIGADQKFEWLASDYASDYTFFLSTQPDLSDATGYDAGTNLFYNYTGLILDTTYYWSVFPSNATGITWSKIKKFKTSSVPPLAASPETVWIEQGQERTVGLDYTGGDASAKTAIITSLPSNGTLYQYDAGSHGAIISTVPTTLTDLDLNVIYVANGGTGNSAGNFNFKIHDNTGDSPVATTTVNISPPGVPNLLYASKGTNIELQFDRTMSDPAGKQNQFVVNVNSTPVTISSASLKAGDPYSIILTLATPLTGSETVLIFYTKGTVSATSGGLLESFANVPVTLLSQTISFTTPLAKKYGDAPFTLGSTSTSGLTSFTYSSSNQAVATVLVSTLTILDLGSSDITARQAGNATWAPARYIKTLTVSKGDQIIAFSVIPSKTYGDADFSLAPTSSSGLSVSLYSGNIAVATVIGNVVHIVGAGTAVITASQAGNAYYNSAPDIPQTLTVSKANQTISFTTLPSKIFGDADFSLSSTSSSGLSVSFAGNNPSVATISGNIVHIVATGSVVITATQAGDANYNAASDVQQTLTVNKANQTISFSALPVKTFGDADFSLSATSSSGLNVSYAGNNPSVATVTGTTVHIVGAGTVTIIASQSGDANFNAATDVPETLTINKATQTITFGSLPEKNYNDPDFTISATSSSGLTVSFTSGTTTVATVSGTTVHIVAGGTSVITASQAGNANYNAAPDVPQTLTIHKLLQTITFTDYPEKLLMTDSHALAATSSVSLPVQFESANTSIATVSGTTVTGVTAGTVQIRAFNNGDANYDPAEASVTIEVYSTHKDIMYLFTPNNDGINDLWELPDLATWGKCDVRVFNRWGKLVFASPDYHNEWDGTSDGGPIPEGAYYFVIKTENNGTVKGTLNLVR